MQYTPVILWTDALLYILAAAGVFFAIMIYRRPHLRQAWRKIIKNKLALVSFIVLLFYISIGLLDSIHFRADAYGVSVESLFDRLVSPLGNQDEESYSAPFATHLYTKNFILLNDGILHYDYPPLHYFHFLGTDKVGQDVLYETLKSIRTGLVIGTLTTLVILPFALFFGLIEG